MEEGEKRKQQEGNNAVSGRRKKAREAEGKGLQTEAATEDEVEEFFAILRRIHVAVSYFDRGNNNRDVRQMTEGGSRLMQTIERECSGGAVNGVESTQRQEGAEQILGLDLNADPDPEVNPI